MKRTFEEIREIKAMNVANCLLLLSNIRRSEETTANNRSGNSRIFECITCNRQFSSFQALGGHRASHKKPRAEAAESSLKSSLEIAMPKIHECSVCGVEFPTGQALGGHMRRHRTATIAPDFISSKTSIVPSSNLQVLMKSNGNRVLCLDLNLTPIENDLNLQIRENLLSPPAVDYCFL